MKNLGNCRTAILRIAMGLLVFGIVFGCQKDLVPTENEATNDAMLKSAKPVNFMVITKSENLPAGFESKLAAYGQIVKSMPEIGIVVVNPTTSNFETKVAKLLEVKAVVPDLIAKWLDPVKFINEANPPSIGDNETFFYRQWGMDAINAPEAWNSGFTGSGARVFILDSGIDADNPDLLPNLNKSLSTSFVEDEIYDVAPGA